jgi:hypothetical protein
MRSMLAFVLLSVCACASTGTSTSPASRDMSQSSEQSCGSFVRAVAGTDTDVYARPDSTSDIVGVLNTRATVCADPTSSGFGFRRVRLANGKDGYVPESVLSNS